MNASFQPLQVISWQKALQLFFSGKVEIVESSEQIIRSVTLTIRMLRVIRLIKYLPPNNRKHIVRFNRNNVFLRDSLPLLQPQKRRQDAGGGGNAPPEPPETTRVAPLFGGAL